MGLCVASDLVLAGCKNVVGTRFRRRRMHWFVPVGAMPSLRCCVVSNHFDDFWSPPKARTAA